MNLRASLQFIKSNSLDGEINLSYTASRQLTPITGIVDVQVRIGKNRFNGVIVIDILYEPTRRPSTISRFRQELCQVAQFKKRRAVMSNHEGVAMQAMHQDGLIWIDIWSLSRISEMITVSSEHKSHIASPMRLRGWALGAVLLGADSLNTLVQFIEKIEVEIEGRRDRRKGLGGDY